MTETVKLDARGLVLPRTCNDVAQFMRDLAIGQEVEVLATDPSTQRDFVKFCTFLEQELLESGEKDGIYHFKIRKQSVC